MIKNLALGFATIFLSVLTTDVNAVSVYAFDTGWYRDDGVHEPSNKNSLTGYLGNEYRGFLLWNIPQFEGNLVSASFSVLMSYPFAVFQSTGQMYDISADNINLISTTNGSGNGLNVFSDLGSGQVYGNISTIGSHDDDWLTFELNAAALSTIYQARGGVFGIGMRNANNEGWFLFSSGSNLGVQNLNLEIATPAVPEPEEWAMMIVGIPLVGWQIRRKQGRKAQ